MDSRRHKKAGYPLHMKGATDTFSFKPTVITYNEANITIKYQNNTSIPSNLNE